MPKRDNWQKKTIYYTSNQNNCIMNKTLLIAAALGTAFALSSCKSQDSAYRKAYLAAQANAEQETPGTTTVAVQDEDVSVTPVAPVAPVTPEVKEEAPDLTDVRTIDAAMKVVKGNPLKTYSVVVGSFQNEANANGLCEQLSKAGHDARVLRTNETVNGLTGWYRVIASSYAEKSAALQSRNSLKAEYKGAWLLYTK